MALPKIDCVAKLQVGFVSFGALSETLSPTMLSGCMQVIEMAAVSTGDNIFVLTVSGLRDQIREFQAADALGGVEIEFLSLVIKQMEKLKLETLIVQR